MYALAVRRYEPGPKDAHGTPAVLHGEPEPWAVWGYAPGDNTEPINANRDLSLIEWTVYAPANEQAPGERDLVVLDGETYRVDGRPADFTKGPWPHPTAGITVLLRKADG